MKRRGLGTLAAYLGGAVTAAGTVVVGVLGGQVLFARRTIPGAQAPPPNSGGRYGREYDADGVALVRLAVLGDSTAAGFGVHTRAETPGAMLATAVAHHTRRPVQLTCPAAVGSPSAWLPVQAETVIEAGTDLAEEGYTNIAHLEGGMKAWEASGRKITYNPKNAAPQAAAHQL